MGFLQQFLDKKKICIQCHNNPDSDTLASAYGLWCFFTDRGIETEIIYSGPKKIEKYNLCYMVRQCGIPVRHAEKLPETELLLIVDGQYGQGNVERFDAPQVAVIDHHMCVQEENERTLIAPDYQSCSTIIWELLEEEGYPVKDNEKLCVALLFGLFIDTASFYDLYREKDTRMRLALEGEYPLFDRLIKSCMTVAELMIVSDAIFNHYLEYRKKFAVVSALKCDQSILGIIGDFVIQVDAILVSFAYTEINGGYQISIRSCDNKVPANQLAVFLCEGIGSGGGHAQKAGGRISIEKYEEKYGKEDFFEFVIRKLNGYIPEAKEWDVPLAPSQKPACLPGEGGGAVILGQLAEKYPQLYLVPGEGMEAAYREVVGKGNPPGTTSLALFHGSVQDWLRTEETPAGPVEVLFLHHREDFENFLRIMSYQCRPEKIPAAIGAMTLDGVINWQKIREHKEQYLAAGHLDWKEEWKRFTSVKGNYTDIMIVISDGPYSNVFAGDAGYVPETWLEISRDIRFYHECAHVVCRKLYPDQKDALWDELVADAMGLRKALGHYDTELAGMFLGVDRDGYRGGRLEYYVPENRRDALPRIAQYVYEIIGRIGQASADWPDTDSYDFLAYLQGRQKTMWDKTIYM